MIGLEKLMEVPRVVRGLPPKNPDKIDIERLYFFQSILVVCFIFLSVMSQSLEAQVQIADIPDQTIGLGGDFSEIDLNNYNLGEEVIWTVNFAAPKNPAAVPSLSISSADFQFEMSVTAMVNSKGKQAIGASHLLVVKDKLGHLQGLSKAIEIAGNWVYFLTVYGNEAGEELQFVFYDAKFGEEIKGQKFEFNPNQILGQPDVPYVINTEVIIASIQNGVLHVNLSDDDFVGVEKLVISATSVINPADIKYDTVMFEVISDYEPLLDSIADQVVAFGDVFQTINLSEFTSLFDNDAVTYASIGGDSISVVIDPASSMATITYPDGWSGEEVVKFTITDQTTKQFSSSWDVKFVVRPQEVAPVLSGLMNQKIGTGGIPIPIDLSKYVTTNNPNGIKWSFQVYNSNPNGAPNWEINTTAFELSMTLTCSFKSYGSNIDGPNYKLAAFNKSDSMLIGLTNSLEVDDNWYFFLTVYGNTTSGDMFFKVYDEGNDRILDVNQTESFVSNAVIGDPVEPLSLSAGFISPRFEGNIVVFDVLNDTWSGVEKFIFIATDTTTTNLLSGNDTMQIEVVDIQSPTLVEIPSLEIYEGESFGPLNLRDYLGGVTFDKVKFSISGADILKPTLLNDRVNVTVPDVNYFGKNELLITATHRDFPEMKAVRKVVYEVINVNDAPVFTGDAPITKTAVGELYRYDINSQDIDDSNLELSITGNPDWLVFVKNRGFGLLFGTPSAQDVGVYNIHIELTDGKEVVIKEYSLEVTNSFARIKAGPLQSVNEGESFKTFNLAVITEKTNDYNVAYLVNEGNELKASIDGSLLSVTIPNVDWFGKEVFNIKLIDQADSAILGQTNMTYEVINVNDAPRITAELLPNGLRDAPYNFEVEIIDKEKDALTYQLIGAPEWLIGVATLKGYLFYGTPKRKDVGSTSFTLVVSDGLAQVSLRYSLKVNNILVTGLDDITMEVYPNPTTDWLSINFVEPIKSVNILNQLGQNVKEVDFDFQKSIVVISVQDLAAGAYFVQVKGTNQTLIKRLLIQN